MNEQAGGWRRPPCVSQQKSHTLTHVCGNVSPLTSVLILIRLKWEEEGVLRPVLFLLSHTFSDFISSYAVVMYKGEKKNPLPQSDCKPK